MIQLYKSLLKEIDELADEYNKLSDSEMDVKGEIIWAVRNEKKRVVAILEKL